jgi:hypothetical protein
MKSVNIKGKEYIEVNERLKFFRSEPQYKGYSLTSEIIEMKDGIITIKAIIKDENGNVVASGFAQEKESSSFINKTSYVENCETSAWGRALGNLGIGIDTSVASYEEVQNAILNQSSITDPDLKNALIDEQLAKEEKKFKCSDCGSEITARAYDYSYNHFGKGLCMNCQKRAKKLA